MLRPPDIASVGQFPQHDPTRLAALTGAIQRVVFCDLLTVRDFLLANVHPEGDL
jgi:hypothetical protein